MFKETSENKVQLTIGIPTFNRAERLSEVLDLLLLEDILDEIEIFVSDNCSQDNTLEILQKYKLSFGKNLIFDSNQSNLGFDGNIKKLYNNANGKYIWFLSDDDEFEKGTVSVLLDHIKKNEDCGLIILNQTVNSKPNIKNNSLIDIVPYSPIGEKLNVETGKIYKVFSEKQRLLAILLSSQISCCCVLRNNLVKVSDEGGGLMHSKLVNLNLLINNNVFITNREFNQTQFQNTLFTMVYGFYFIRDT